MCEWYTSIFITVALPSFLCRTHREKSYKIYFFLYSSSLVQTHTRTHNSGNIKTPTNVFNIESRQRKKPVKWKIVLYRHLFGSSRQQTRVGPQRNLIMYVLVPFGIWTA